MRVGGGARKLVIILPFLAVLAVALAVLFPQRLGSMVTTILWRGRLSTDVRMKLVVPCGSEYAFTVRETWRDAELKLFHQETDVFLADHPEGGLGTRTDLSKVTEFVVLWVDREGKTIRRENGPSKDFHVSRPDSRSLKFSIKSVPCPGS